MNRRRWVILVASFFGLILAAYLFVGIQLGLEGRQALKEGKALAASLGNLGDGGPSLDSSIASLLHHAKSLDAKISNPMFKPFIWVSGQTHRFNQLQDAIAQGERLMQVAPGLLGSHGSRKYLIAFQNNAEARGTGGIIGGYAEIQVTNGQIKILRLGSNAKLKSLDVMPILISSEFYDLYGNDPAIWQNSNEDAHFPYAARIWLALWQKQFGEKLDGVLTVDPVALSYVLKVVGPVTMADGQVITSQNIVEQTLSVAYARFATDNARRKSYLVDIAHLVLQKLLAGGYSKISLGRQLITPWNQGRLLFYSTNETEEAALATTKFGGDITTNAKNEYLSTVINTDGNKMDYYLDQSVSIKSLACTPVRTTQITLTARNSVPAGAVLPSYVMGRLDLGMPNGYHNSHGFSVGIYGPLDSKLVSARIVGSNDQLNLSHVELGRPVFFASADLNPGSSVKIIANFSGGEGPIAYRTAPQVRPVNTSISDHC